MRKNLPSVDHNKDVKCYAHCLLELEGTITNGKFNADNAYKRLDNAPAELHDLLKSSVDRCKNVGDGIKDPCDYSYAILKCAYEGVPEKFINTFN